MKIALIGYGNMGREIENLVSQNKKHQIISISYKAMTDSLDVTGIKNSDIAIDFTAPDVVISNISKISKLGINMVVGTTGWYDKIEDVKKIVKENNVGLVYGSNFSIGINVFFQIVKEASKLFSKFDYDVYGVEVHHTGKKDSPSGTAKTLGTIIMQNYKTKKVFQNERVNRLIKTDELHFASVRAGTNPGRHEIVFDSEADEVRLVHQARGRRGFAEGALAAAEFINKRKGFYLFEEIFGKISV